jgi:SAM-dependent methyltransferase
MLSIVRKVLRRFDVHDAIYDAAYYAADVAGPADQAAPHIAASIVHHFAPRRAIDIGCGTGAMLAALKALGVDVYGLEYASAAIELCQARGLPVQRFNIEKDDFPAVAPADVVLSTEVAEHLPERVADRYVALLCHFGTVVVMSAAQPGQGGTDHVNLQPPSYWIGKFADRGYRHDRKRSEAIAESWKKNGVADFYHENLMVFRRGS